MRAMPDVADRQPWTALREARTAAGLSQAALADQLGTTKPQISSWESGRFAPTDATLARLRAVLPALQPPPQPQGDTGKAERAVKFGEWIAAGRVAKGWTIGDAARTAGLPRSTWSNIERGQQHNNLGDLPFIPGWDVTVRVAEVLGLDVTEALSRAGHGGTKAVESPAWSSRRLTQLLTQLDAAQRFALTSLAEGLLEPTVKAGGTASVVDGDDIYRGEVTEVKVSRDGKTIRLTVTVEDVGEQ